MGMRQGVLYCDACGATIPKGHGLACWGGKVLCDACAEPIRRRASARRAQAACVIAAVVGTLSAAVLVGALIYMASRGGRFQGDLATGAVANALVGVRALLVAIGGLGLTAVLLLAVACRRLGQLLRVVLPVELTHRKPEPLADGSAPAAAPTGEKFLRGVAEHIDAQP